MEKKKIIVEPSPDHPGILDVRDAMQQVIDYFELLTDRSLNNVVWNLEYASTNSPFTAVGSPVDLRTQAGAFGLVGQYVDRVERGLIRLQAGEALDEDFPDEKRDVLAKMLKRNMNGIGKTKFAVGDNGAELSIDPISAERSLRIVRGSTDEMYDYLYATFSRKEYGSIEGRIIEVKTDYDEPAVKLREHRSGREIQCRVSDEARAEIENSLTAGDVWKHRRARIRGIINYDPTGKILRVLDGKIGFIDERRSTIDDLHDPDFTEGMSAYNYLQYLREI